MATAEEPAKKLTFTSVSGAIGLVSGVLGIFQAWKEIGGSVVDAVWNGLYYVGYIAFASLAVWATLGWLFANILLAREKKPGRKSEDYMATYGVLIPCLVIGAWIGILWANDSITLVANEAASGRVVDWTKSKALPPNVMRVIGMVAVGLPIALRFLPPPKDKVETSDV